MMTGYLIGFHSIVDVITNSSTEIYTINQAEEVEVIDKMIREFESTLNMSGYQRVSVYRAEGYDLSEIFDVYTDDETLIKYLKAKGYEVTGDPSNPPRSPFIRISCERGYMHPEMKAFIEKMFNVEDYDC